MLVKLIISFIIVTPQQLFYLMGVTIDELSFTFLSYPWHLNVNDAMIEK